MGPLTGQRVVEFCQVAAGPYCGMLLGDMGCDVIKVESPQGDTLRAWPPFTDGFSENFASLNRNKRSIVLDLKSASGREAARRLVASADVLIENNRPGVMDRLGLGYPTFQSAHPELIYCSISAFGQEGPRAAEGGFDLTVQAISGIMSVTGEPDGEPVKCGVPISDFVAGLYAAFSVAAMLARVQQGGLGGHIDVPMMGATLAVAALQTSEYFGNGADPGRLGSAHPRNAPYRAFSAADGHFVMAAGNDKLWRSVCRAIGRDDLAEDVRFASTAARAVNQAELKMILEDVFKGRPVAEWVGLFSGLGVPCGPINRISEALADKQTRHLGWVEETELPSGRRIRSFGSPIALSGQRPAIARRPPALGEHTEEILAEITARELTESGA